MAFSNIQELSWQDVRVDTCLVEPELAKIIDSWGAASDYTFIKIRYPFGSKILDNGIFSIPNDMGELIPITDSSVPAALKEKLGYHTLPLGFINTNGAELYREIKDGDKSRIFSLAFLQRGLQLGIYEFFGHRAPYSLSAGARSLVLIPKISDTESFKKLKHYCGLRSGLPKTLIEQEALFVEIAKRREIDWYVDVYFLTNKWVDKKAANWKDFYCFLLERAWKHTEYARDRTVFEVSWQSFTQRLKQKGIKPDPFLIETLRHLIFSAQGTLPTFKPADSSNTVGPISELQKLFTDIYGLRYAPTIMRPTHYDYKSDDPVYYSIMHPNILETFPRMKAYASSADTLRDLKEILDHFKDDLLNGRLEFYNDNLKEILRQTQFDYFHSEMHTYGGIKPTSDLAKEDPKLLTVHGGISDKEFAYKGSFLRCCIRISHKKNGVI